MGEPELLTIFVGLGQLSISGTEVWFTDTLRRPGARCFISVLLWFETGVVGVQVTSAKLKPQSSRITNPGRRKLPLLSHTGFVMATSQPSILTKNPGPNPKNSNVSQSAGTKLLVAEMTSASSHSIERSHYGWEIQAFLLSFLLNLEFVFTAPRLAEHARC